MKIAPVLAASLFLSLAACTSSNTPAEEQDRGLEGEGAASSAPDVNPDGVPYPSDGIGRLARKGETPGSRIENFKFLGYPDKEDGSGPDISAGLKPISLAQFYDPSGARYKIIHIQASGVWCVYCQAETKLVAQMKADLEAKGVVWLMSLAEGRTPGTPSKQSDLDGWIANYKAPYTQWIDPGNAQLGPFYNAAALPWNANIDATTMEILTAQEGAATTKEAVLEEVDNALALAAKSKLRNPQ